MPDIVTSDVRSAMMSRVKGKDTGPERLVRSLLHGMGYRFRLHRKDLPGKPDIVLPKYKKIIFVHGCFWHQHPGCARSSRPNTRTEFWNAKLDRNVERDKEAEAEIGRLGWTVLIVWECELKDREALRKRLELFIGENHCG